MARVGHTVIQVLRLEAGPARLVATVHGPPLDGEPAGAELGVAFSVRTPHDSATRRRACACPWCDRQLLGEQDQFCDLCQADLAAGGECRYHGASA